MKGNNQKDPIKPDILQSLLSMVDVEVPLRILKGWFPEQREAAEKWAAKAHLRASDNIVRVPAMPSILEKYKRRYEDN